ncbi:transposase, partial [Kitasatospora sp. NPDC018058]|uniref:transposase n=1 Tax=Kitasatospora sp. NPDC018058 TaxID=3364025 RepID=UPI0037BF03D7
VGSAKTYGVALITPVLLDTSRQAKAQEGFAAHDFAVDWDNRQAVCPSGKTSTTWNNVVQEDVTKTVVSFAALDCIPCPFRDRCTSARSNRRQLSLHPRELTEAIRDARNRQQTGTWQRDYALRAGVEGTIRQATHTTGLRRARYRGLAKTHLDHTTSATALNLIRLHSWWNGRPLHGSRPPARLRHRRRRRPARPPGPGPGPDRRRRPRPPAVTGCPCGCPGGCSCGCL